MPTPSIAKAKANMAITEQQLVTHQERLLRISAVLFQTGLSRGVIYRRMASGAFPQAVRLHGKCVAWKENEIDTWIKGRPLAADTHSEEIQ